MSITEMYNFSRHCAFSAKRGGISGKKLTRNAGFPYTGKNSKNAGNPPGGRRRGPGGRSAAERSITMKTADPKLPKLRRAQRRGTGRNAAGKKISVFLRWTVFAAGAAGLVWFLIPTGWNILNIGNGLGIIVCLVLTAGSLLWNKIRGACRRSRAFRVVFRCAAALLCAAALWSAGMTACMLSAAAAKPPAGATVVVLGSMVNGTAPSADLQARIDAAAAYLNAHPDATCVASGGRGRGESISEAEAIRRALVSEGIGAGRILPEDRSRTTRENLENSLRIIGEKGLNRRLALVTDDYHEFRACSMARSLGAKPYAVPARTPWYILSSCWSREVLALAKYLLLPA